MPVSGRKFCRLLEKNGWQLRRVKGSHHIYASGDGKKIAPVPVHGNKPMTKGMLSHLEKTTGVKAR